MNKKENSVIYINYSPYENAGKILDFLLENFSYVYLFTIAFHPLGRKQKSNKIVIYKDRKILKEISMNYMYIPPKLVFFLIPIRSSLNLLQLFWHAFAIARVYGKIDVCFSVNAFTNWGGLILKRLGLVKKTVFWVWDYYPLKHKSSVIRFMRFLYWQFDKSASRADRVAYLNKTMAKVRKKAGMKLGLRYLVVPIGTEAGGKLRGRVSREIRLGFVGVLKRSQGLDLVFDSADLLQKDFPGISVDIIGSGPDEEYFRKKARKSPIKTTFYGLVSETVLKKVLSKCTIGIAPYVPDESNVSYYGDPAKVKKYLELGLPTIITNVFEFSGELVQKKAGVVVDYYQPTQFVKGIKRIISNYDYYQNNTIKLNDKYDYKKLYPKMFDF